MDKLIRKSTKNDEDSSSSSNEDEMPQCLEKLSLQDKKGSSAAPPKLYDFLKTKHINKKCKIADKKRQNGKVFELRQKIQQLQKKLAQKQHKFCPNCRYHLNEAVPEDATRMASVDLQDYQLPQNYQARRHSKESLQFQKLDFGAALLSSPEMQEKGWIFLGMVMIAMGSKVMDFDGTVNVFKVLKESVDSIRRQVDKCQPTLTMDFFLSKQEMQMQQDVSSNGLMFDPFLPVQGEQNGGLRLEGVRVESVEQFDLFFDQKIRYSVGYEALLRVLQYIREHVRMQIE